MPPRTHGVKKHPRGQQKKVLSRGCKLHCYLCNPAPSQSSGLFSLYCMLRQCKECSYFTLFI